MGQANGESCELELSEEYYVPIAKAIAVHALEGHPKDFVSQPNRIPEKKWPWTFKENIEADIDKLAALIVDVMSNAEALSWQPDFKLRPESSEPLARDRYAWWEDRTGLFIVYEPTSDDCGSAYRPTDGKDHFDSQELKD